MVVTVRCERCGKMMEEAAAREAGWLIAAQRHGDPSNYGRLVVRCTEHVNAETLMATGQGERYERVAEDWRGSDKPWQLAFVWHGKAVGEFAYYPSRCYYHKPICFERVIGLTVDELKARGFFHTPLTRKAADGAVPQ